MIFRLMYTIKFYELVVLNIDIVLVAFEYFYFLFFEPYALREFRKGSVHFIIYRGNIPNTVKIFIFRVNPN